MWKRDRVFRVRRNRVEEVNPFLIAGLPECAGSKRVMTLTLFALNMWFWHPRTCHPLRRTCVSDELQYLKKCILCTNSLCVMYAPLVSSTSKRI